MLNWRRMHIHQDLCTHCRTTYTCKGDFRRCEEEVNHLPSEGEGVWREKSEAHLLSSGGESRFREAR